MNKLFPLRHLLNNYQIIFNVICFIWFFGTILQYNYNAIWNFYGDHVDYLRQSGFSLFSFSFYAPSPFFGFSPRPFTVPLFYKIMQGDQLSIVWMQKIMYCLAVLSFVTSISIIIKNKLIRFLALPTLYYFFTWWPILGFTENLLSESLSMTFLFLWLSSIIYFIRYKNKLTFIFMIVITVLFSFTRDTWPYIILASSILLFIYFRKDLLLKKFLIINCFFSIMLFFVQSATSNIGHRFKIPLYNVLVTRISKSPEYIKWFQDKGMPMGDYLIENFGNLDLRLDPDVQKLYDTYLDKKFVPLQKWVLKDGKSAYMLFMLTHPSYFFLKDQTDYEVARIFTIYDLEYIPESRNQFLYDNSIRDIFSLNVFMITLIILSVFYFIFKYKNIYAFFPFYVSILFLLNVFLSYNADTLEVERHLFITQIIIQLMFYITIILILDSVFNKIEIYYSNKKNSIT